MRPFLTTSMFSSCFSTWFKLSDMWFLTLVHLGNITWRKKKFEQRKGEIFILMMEILSQAWFGSLQVDLHTAAEWTDIIGCQGKDQSAGVVWWMNTCRSRQRYILKRRRPHWVSTILSYDWWCDRTWSQRNECFWYLRHILLIKPLLNYHSECKTIICSRANFT